MASIHQSALKLGAIHYVASLGRAFLVVAGAASGLSDSSHGDSGEGAIAALSFIIQAPVAITQLIAARLSPGGQTGLQISTLLMIAMPSSLGYGYLISYLVRKLKE